MILSANGQNIYPEEIESLINAEDYVLESLVLDRKGKLSALIFMDYDSLSKNGIDEAALLEWTEKMRLRINRLLPSYSQLGSIELKSEPFEKTPKMSIKRYLYR